jgi:DNA polymerase elongation subunit (family B)
VIIVKDEVGLIEMFIHLVFRIDPDIIGGYDTE